MPGEHKLYIRFLSWNSIESAFKITKSEEKLSFFLKLIVELFLVVIIPAVIPSAPISIIMSVLTGPFFHHFIMRTRIFTMLYIFFHMSTFLFMGTFYIIPRLDMLTMNSITSKVLIIRILNPPSKLIFVNTKVKFFTYERMV